MKQLNNREIQQVSGAILYTDGYIVVTSNYGIPDPYFQILENYMQGYLNGVLTDDQFVCNIYSTVPVQYVEQYISNLKNDTQVLTVVVY